MNAWHQYRIAPYGEFGWIAQLDGANDPVAAALYVNAVADALRNCKGVVDCVAGVDSLVVRIDPRARSVEDARAILEEALDATPETPGEPGKRIEIPVCYGGDFGPDLEGLCNIAGLTPHKVIDIHKKQTYRVLTVGFAPGFAYLGPLDPALAAPRLDTPRLHVSAGSVGVAGAMTGVYPLASPGGWRIIGRTPATLFNAAADEPFKFAPGDQVRFTQISEEEFHAIKDATP